MTALPTVEIIASCYDCDPPRVERFLDQDKMDMWTGSHNVVYPGHRAAVEEHPRWEPDIGPYTHRAAIETELASMLRRLEAANGNPLLCHRLVVRAAGLAERLGYHVHFGVGVDPSRTWHHPVLCIELPTGQVSWPLIDAADNDPVDDREKFRRCREYSDLVCGTDDNTTLLGLHGGTVS